MAGTTAFGAMLTAGVVLIGCGGIPDSHRNALGIEQGVSGIRSCVGNTDSDGVIAIVGFDVPGDEPVVFEAVESVDASGAPVDVFVVNVPEGDTAFGASHLDTVGSDEALAAVWAARARPPADALPGHFAQLLAVLPPPNRPGAENRLGEFEITVRVGGDRETYTWQTDHVHLGGEVDCSGIVDEDRATATSSDADGIAGLDAVGGPEFVAEVLSDARAAWEESEIGSYRLTVSEDENYWSRGCTWVSTVRNGSVVDVVTASASTTECTDVEWTVDELHNMIERMIDQVVENSALEFGPHVLDVRFDTSGVPETITFDLSNGADEETSMRVEFDPMP